MEIDIELENGDLIEVKNIDFSKYKKSGDFIKKNRYNDLEEKLEKYAAAKDEKDESLGGQRIIVAARGNPDNNPDLETLEQTIESQIEDRYGWDVEVSFKSIDNLDSV